MTRVMLVDDHALVRKGLCSLIETQPRMEVVAEAADAASAISAYEASRPDVVLLDMKLPDKSGIEVLGQILSIDPAAKVVMLSAFDFPDQVAACIRAGARGYLSKDLDPAELFRSIETVAGGGTALGAAQLAALVATGPTSGQPKSNTALTVREREVASLVAQGETNKEIAQALCISPSTVKAHVASILAKLGLRGRVELASWVLAEGRNRQA